MIGTEKSMEFAVRIDAKFAGQGYEYMVLPGRKYDKIVRVPDSGSGRSVYAFVDRETGDLLKADSWKKPATGVRYTGEELLTRAVDEADPYGSFLYNR